MGKPVIVLGGGGHAKVLLDTLKLNRVHVIGVADVDPNYSKKNFLEIPIIGDDQVVLNYDFEEIELVNGLGSIESTKRRRELFEFFKSRGYSFAKVIHPSAIIAADVEIHEGVQIMAGAILQTGCEIGMNTIVNTKVSVDHDCRIGSHVHLAPGTTLSGGVIVEDDVHVGIGTSIIQGIRLHQGSLVGAGSVVIRNVEKGTRVFGVPAKEIIV